MVAAPRRERKEDPNGTVASSRQHGMYFAAYPDPIDAAGARELIEKAIVDAVLITGAGR